LNQGFEAFSIQFNCRRPDLCRNVCVAAGSRKLAEKKAKKRTASTVFDRLVAAGERLLAVIQKNREGANKDMARFADQINALCDKWEK
ncbi:MAG: MBL fold metallo-hydrolase, partial [Clostridiales bacterium]|nr:MBL fold metallo-hydrolase [Clostridiales bacterium]